MEKHLSQITVMILLMAIVFSVPSLGASDGMTYEREARQLYEKALKIYGAEQYTEAIPVFNKISACYSGTIYSQKSAYLIRLILEYKMPLRQLEGFLDSPDETHELNKHCIQGMIYLRQKELDKAFLEFQEILINPSMKRWWPYAKEMIFVDNINTLKKNPAKAQKMFKAMLETDDVDSKELIRIYKIMASLYEETKMYKENRSIYNKLIGLVSEEEKIQYYEKLGVVYYNLQDRNNAITTWGKMLAMNPEEHRMSNIARYFVEYRMYKEAEDIYRKLLVLKPGNSSYHQELAKIYQKQKKYDAAIDEYNKAYDLADNEYARRNVNYALIQLHKESGNLKKFMTEKKARLAQVEYKLTQAYRKAALVYEEKKDYDKAANLYRKALVFCPEDKTLKESLAKVIALTKEPEY
jgi:tetratricopeptide (TPR) repeat protein